MEYQHITHFAISLLTLTFIEIVLGIDNLIFLSIITEKLPQEKRKKARLFGLLLALVTRLLFLATVVWIAQLKNPLFSIGKFSFSGRDIFLIGGGIFLIFKSTQEIHEEFSECAPLDHKEGKSPCATKGKRASFWVVILQIAILDIIFSLDSIITAIGLTQEFWIMAIAIAIAIFAMIFLSEGLSNFIYAHPTIKMLALSFLLLIGTALIADGFQVHIPRGYIYFAIAFSVLIESLNIALARKKKKREELEKAKPPKKIPYV